MDLFSHALLPYLLGNFFKRKKSEVTSLVLGGIAPDFDILIFWINLVYPNFFLITHRGITHSLIFGFFTGIIVLYLASLSGIKNRVQRYVAFEPLLSKSTVAFAFAGVLTHLFLDFVTTRGIPLFYPFSTTRYAGEVFFYTDIYLTIVSLTIVILLFKKPQNSTKFLIVFLIAFSALGTLRIVEKSSAEQFFNSEVKAFPTMDAFYWYALSESKNEISVFDYNGYNRSSSYNETVPKLNILSQGEGLDNALAAAGELPQVKMFRWRAYAVVVNASFVNNTWHLEYNDPLQRAMIKDVSPALRSIFARRGSIKVIVEGGKAEVQ